MDFKNKSDFDLIVSGYSFDIQVNGSSVATVKHLSQQLVKSNDFSVLNLDIEFNPIDVFKDNKGKLVRFAVDIATNKKNIVFKIIGVISGGALGVTAKDIPVEMTLTLAEIMSPSEAIEKCK